MALSDAEVARYARQLILPGFGPLAQEFLRAARVHVVGAGDVAGPALLYLAAAGIGTLYVDDGADVSPEDTAAWLYGAEQVGQPRIFAAVEAVRAAAGGGEPLLQVPGERRLPGAVHAGDPEDEAGLRLRVHSVPPGGRSVLGEWPAV